MKKTLFILGIGLLALGSCKKEGCNNSNASNYDSGAEKDDGSCTFEGNVVFYYSQNTYLNDLLPNGYTNLDYYVDGNILGTKSADNSWTASGTPDCSAGDLMTGTLDMAGQESRLYTFEVKNNADDVVIFSGDQIINANTCNAILLQ